MDIFDSLKDGISILHNKLQYKKDQIREQWTLHETTTKPCELRIAYITHTGKVRPHNEDNFAIEGKRLSVEHQSMDEVKLMNRPVSEVKGMAVFDGIGGAEDGEMASYVAAGSFLKRTYYGMKDESEIHDLMQLLNQDVCTANREDFQAVMGTTMVSIFFHDDKVVFANLGDSPSYLYRKGELSKTYFPHTNAEFMKAMGITRRKPKLIQYLGMDIEGMLLDPYITSFTIQPDDIYLLCSDGLTDMVTEDEIAEIIKREKSLKEIVEDLLDAALDAGGRDNITILMCQVHERK